MSAAPDFEPDPATVIGHVFTHHAARYMTQLGKHWSHRFEVELGPTTAAIPLPLGPVYLQAEPEPLIITLEPNPDADIAKMKQVVESHLDRFAFREGGLTYLWSE